MIVIATVSTTGGIVLACWGIALLAICTVINEIKRRRKNSSR